MNTKLLCDLKNLAIINHYHCEDGWYSCPKSEEGCYDDSQGDECNCGAEEHNKKVNEIYNKILKFGQKMKIIQDYDMILRWNCPYCGKENKDDAEDVYEALYCQYCEKEKECLLPEE